MSDRPSWMPSDEEIREAGKRCAVLVGLGEMNATEGLRSLIRAAVERALAERERVWISALKEVNGEAVCHRDFREMWAKAESNPIYWAELLRLSMQTLREQEARRKQEVIAARIEEIENFEGFFYSLKRIEELHAELAALEVKS